MQRIHLIAYAAALVSFLAIDLLWLGVVARDFYRNQLGTLLLDKPRMDIGLAFYAFYCVGIVVFAVLPALAAGDWTRAALLGALFGAIAYATYDLTNLATLRDWPVTMAVVDIVWGTVLTASVATISFLVARTF